MGQQRGNHLAHQAVKGPATMTGISYGGRIRYAQNENGNVLMSIIVSVEILWKVMEN